MRGEKTESGIYKSQYKATAKYCKHHYDVLTIRLPKGEREDIKQRIEKLGGASVNNYVVDAIYEKLERDENQGAEAPKTAEKKERESNMTLYDVLEENKDSEITVWDTDYDVEVYFTYVDSDDWDKAMLKIAKALTVVEQTDSGCTCNISEVIEKHIGELDFDKLFISSDIDDIMNDLENILAGNVSESWLTKFANCLA